MKEEEGSTTFGKELFLVGWGQKRNRTQVEDRSHCSKPHPNRLNSFLNWRAEVPKNSMVGRGKKPRRNVETISEEKSMVIEISSSSDEAEEGRRRKRKRRRIYSDVEVKTREEKRREEEDCCILPFDPFAADLNEKLSLAAAKHQLDDLSVVAERGQVACRDYPHSRHVCAEYPFSKTSHESCCIQCYCYVCDEAAPCKFWKGLNGHCHASDRDRAWKEMRTVHQRMKPYVIKTHF